MSSNNSYIVAVRRIFIGTSGRMRIIWQLILTLFIWYVLSFTSAYLLSRLMLHIFNGWGVTSTNITRAPAWVQLIAVYQTQLNGAASALIASVIAVFALKRFAGISLRPSMRSMKASVLGSVAGIVIPLLLMGIFLLCDSMRITMPVPHFSIHILLVLSFSAVTAIAETLIAFGYMRIVCTRQYGRVTGIMISAIVFCLMNMLSFGNVLSAINALLIGIALSIVSEKFGLSGCAALRCAWLWTISSISGFPESSHGLFTMYPVSENIITGGYYGPEAGLAVTSICFTVCLTSLIIPSIQKLKKS